MGTAFYGYDAMLDSLNMGYRGPTFSYARIPDQYTWQHFYERELAGRARPGHGRDRLRVVAHAVDAAAAASCRGRRSATARCSTRSPPKDSAPVEVWPDPQRVQEVYGQSVEYTLGAMFSFLHTYDQPNLVLVVLGDHQPARIVSGPDADHDVPITIISKDPRSSTRSPRGSGRPASTRRRMRRCGGWISSAIGSSRPSAAERRATSDVAAGGSVVCVEGRLDRHPVA